MTYDTNVQFDSECNDCRALDRQIKSLTDENAQMKNSLSRLLKFIDEGVLIRDISKDHEPGWAIKILPLVVVLKEARKLLGE